MFFSFSRVNLRFKFVAYLEKQSQFLQGKMSVNVCMKGNYEEFHALKAAENKAKFVLRSACCGLRYGNFANGLRDYHGPSGLAMTTLYLHLCASVPLWLYTYLKKQSQC
jgi:hypothetical protein